MPTTRFSLLRHGETGFQGFRGRTDDALSETGLQQMRNAIKGRPDWQHIISSPLQRCRLFAEELAEKLQLDLLIEHRLQELDFGEWEGCTAEELMQTQSALLGAFWNDPYQHPPPGGENMNQFEARIMQAMDEITRLHSGKSILVVTHGGVIRVLLSKRDALARDQLLTVNVPHASLHRLDYPV